MAYTDFLNKYVLGPKTQIRTEKNDLKSVADTEAELQKQINKKQVNEGEILNTPGTVDPGFLKSDGTVKDAGQDVNKNSYGDSENIEVNKNKGKRFGGAKFKNTGFETQFLKQTICVYLYLLALQKNLTKFQNLMRKINICFYLLQTNIHL